MRKRIGAGVLSLLVVVGAMLVSASPAGADSDWRDGRYPWEFGCHAWPGESGTQINQYLGDTEPLRDLYGYTYGKVRWVYQVEGPCAHFQWPILQVWDRIDAPDGNTVYLETLDYNPNGRRSFWANQGRYLNPSDGYFGTMVYARTELICVQIHNAYDHGTFYEVKFRGRNCA